jgi:hypothetical protein
MEDVIIYRYKVHGCEKQLMQAQVGPLQASVQTKNKLHIHTI